jgi:hypothetical protein
MDFLCTGVLQEVLGRYGSGPPHDGDGEKGEGKAKERQKRRAKRNEMHDHGFDRQQHGMAFISLKGGF